MKISVIIPIYNSEKFLSKCLDSVINQTYKNLEIILINDGSSDNSLEICKNFAEKDSRIIILTQNNQGVSAARNLGISKATGDFIHFLDSDDYINNEMYTDLINYILSHNLDIMCCKVTRDKNFTKPSNPDFIIRNTFDATVHGLLGNDVGPCDKLIKTNILKKIKFPIDRKFEDVATTFKFYHYANRVGYIQTPYYYYTLNPKSATQTSFNSKQRFDYVKSSIDRYNFAKDNNYKNCLSFCISQIIKGCLSTLTTLYIEHENPKNSTFYPSIKKLILKFKNNDQAIKLLNTKYKVLLWSFERIPLIHKKYAQLSYWQKKRKKR